MSDPGSDAETRDAGPHEPLSEAETVDAVEVQVPVDSLAQKTAFNQVAAALFGEENAAPRVDNYFLLEKLGAGAMGVVYAAYDPDLDRKVAIKLLLDPGQSDGTDPHHQRLVREARSLAQLNHPNVVTVHGVGRSERGSYVAMEYVVGQDLAEWLRERPSTDRVLDVFIQAGRGLAAAHQAGIVHRDFKPHNVLLGGDGVVRVADFGLARQESSATSDVAPGMKTDPAGGVELTRTGGVVGTPLYMAPEQHMGESVGPAADQFAFCASLYEGLYGEPPFEGAGLAALVEEKLSGELEARGKADVPRWLGKIVSRGLAPAPEDRWPDMATLIDAIEEGRRPRRGAWYLAAGAAAVGLVALVGWPESAATAPDPCTEMRAGLTAAWNDDIRARAEQAALATGLPYAEPTWSSVQRVLDDYAVEWSESREQACRAHERAEESDELYQRRLECLDERQRQLGQVATAFTEADAQTLERAMDLVGAIDPVEGCQAPASIFMQQVRPEDPAERKKGMETLAQTDRAWSLYSLGRTKEAEEISSGLRTELDVITDLAARAEVLRLSSEFTPDKRAKIATARRGLREAIRSRDEGRVLFAYGTLVTHLNFAGEWDEAIEQLEMALAVCDRAESLAPDDASWLEFLNTNRGTYETLYAAALSGKGDHHGSIAHFERALELREPIKDTQPEKYIVTQNNYGEVLRKTARYEEAIDHYEHALVVAQGFHGVEHPNVAMILGNRAATLIEMGRFDRAREDIERVLTILRVKFGERHFQIGLNLFNLATIELAGGNLDRAQALAEQTESIFQEFSPAPSALVGIAMVMRGSIQRAKGNLDEAEKLGVDSVAMLRIAFPQPHELLATGLTELGTTQLERGRLTQAEATLRDALRSFEQSVGTETVTAALTKALIGHLLTQRRAYEEAETFFAQARTTLEPYGEHPSLVEVLRLQAELLAATQREAEAIDALRKGLEIAAQGNTDALLNRTVQGRSRRVARARSRAGRTDSRGQGGLRAARTPGGRVAPRARGLGRPGLEPNRRVSRNKRTCPAVSSLLNDLQYERHLNRKAQRLGMAIAALGVLFLLYSFFDPTLQGLQPPSVVFHIIDVAFGVALIVEGIRRIALGRGPRGPRRGDLRRPSRVGLVT